MPPSHQSQTSFMQPQWWEPVPGAVQEQLAELGCTRGGSGSPATSSSCRACVRAFKGGWSKSRFFTIWSQSFLKADHPFSLTPCKGKALQEENTRQQVVDAQLICPYSSLCFQLTSHLLFRRWGEWLWANQPLHPSLWRKEYFSSPTEALHGQAQGREKLYSFQQQFGFFFLLMPLESVEMIISASLIFAIILVPAKPRWEREAD